MQDQSRLTGQGIASWDHAGHSLVLHVQYCKRQQQSWFTKSNESALVGGCAIMSVGAGMHGQPFQSGSVSRG